MMNAVELCDSLTKEMERLREYDPRHIQIVAVKIGRRLNELEALRRAIEALEEERQLAGIRSDESVEVRTERALAEIEGILK